MSFQSHKQCVRNFFLSLDSASPEATAKTIADFCSPEHNSYLSFPWRRLNTSRELAEQFWVPFKQSFTAMQRREDIFFAGNNSGDGTTWVVSTGHYMGLFDRTWLDIPPTRRTTMIRYAEFHRVEADQIVQSGLFIDLIGVLRQAGFDPLPNETGHHFVYPGPRTHDGVLASEQNATETQRTAALIDKMVCDLDELNKSGDGHCSPKLLARSWHDDMVWYGPAGIGASHTIHRYQEQHQYPFREGLKNKVFIGHIARVCEGNYAGFFGWPNLKNSPAGFLGVPQSNQLVDMQVVDIYRRDGKKLAENWVIIDFPHWLAQQGVDVFDCLRGNQP